MNLCEFPIGYLGKRPPNGVKTLEFEDRVWDVAGHRYVPQKRTVIGSDKYGLPSWYDEDVLLALLQLSKLQSDFQSPRVDFSRYQIVELLSLDRSGRTYDRIKEAILRLYSITIECERSWYIKEKKIWSPGTKPIRIFADAHVYAESACSKQSSFSLSYVEFGEQIFESLRTGFVRTFDLERYNELKIPAAKRAMRYLGKCFHRSDPWREDFRTFNCEHLGFDRRYDNSNLKRHAKRYVDDLERVGIIKPMPFEKRIIKGDQRGKYEILFEKPAVGFVLSPADVKLAEPMTPVVQALVQHGVTKATAQSIALKHEDDYIQSKIEFVDWEISHGKKKIDSPGGYLRTAIEQDFEPPKGFKSKADRDASQAKAEARKQRLKDQEAAFDQQRANASAEEEQRVADYLVNLDHGQRFALERKAIQEAAEFLKNRYYKARDKKPAVEQETKGMIIHAHVLQLLDKSDEPFTLERAG